MGAGASADRVIEDELKRPVDASDIESVEAGKAEVVRLRSLIAAGIAADHLDEAKKWLVCVDGSEDAQCGFDNAMNLMKASDHITLLHFTDDAKNEYLPDKMKAPSIQEHYGNSLLATIPAERYLIDVVPRPSPEAGWLKDAVCAYSVDHKTDVLVVGFTGRKGPKEDPTVLGSNGDLAMRQSRCTTLLTKKQWGAPAEKTGRTFAVALDGSSRSEAALLDARRLSNGDDTILALHVKDHRIDGSLDEEFKHDTIFNKYAGGARVGGLVGGPPTSQNALEI